jgi:hypothetical protein
VGSGRGDTVVGNFDVAFVLNGGPFSISTTSSSSSLFTHGGGGLIIKLRAQPGFTSDTSCSPVGVAYSAEDPSGYFVLRFMYDNDGEWPWTFSHPLAAGFEVR